MSHEWMVVFVENGGVILEAAYQIEGNNRGTNG